MGNDVSFEYRDYTEIGIKAEKEFIDAVIKLNPTIDIIKATEQEDMLEHWDYMFNNIKIDVKARRHIGVLNANGDRYTFLELINRNGEKGSLYGKADYLAFEIVRQYLDSFLIVPRIELVKYVEQHLIDEFVIDQNKSVNKKYQGFNTNYVLTCVSLDELAMLPNSKLINKN